MNQTLPCQSPPHTPVTLGLPRGERGRPPIPPGLLWPAVGKIPQGHLRGWRWWRTGGSGTPLGDTHRCPEWPSTKVQKVGDPGIPGVPEMDGCGSDGPCPPGETEAGCGMPCTAVPIPAPRHPASARAPRSPPLTTETWRPRRSGRTARLWPRDGAGRPGSGEGPRAAAQVP